MVNVFDDMAIEYDQTFTHSLTGKLQRDKVWLYLETSGILKKELSVLELNCGTGEDAITFASKSKEINVIATDSSEQMLRIAEEKAVERKVSSNLSFMQLKIEDVKPGIFSTKFELVFSNFGGLNCVDEQALYNLSSNLPGILEPEGRFIAVLMPENCLWENIYFGMKLKFKKAFRRKKKHLLFRSENGKAMPVKYYNPADIKNIFSSNFNVESIKPVGFFLPPGYLENFIEKRTGLLKSLDSLETRFATGKHLAKYSDHFLIDLKLKPNLK